MNNFRMQVDMDNAAFDDGADGRAELARILREAADRVERGEEVATIRDINGNTVCQFDIERMN